MNYHSMHLLNMILFISSHYLLVISPAAVIKIVVKVQLQYRWRNVNPTTMPISLGEWRVRIGRFMRRKPVEVDFEKIIETILERRRQILQKVDDLLENTRENAAKQKAGDDSTDISSSSASSSDIQSDSGSIISSTDEGFRNTRLTRVEPDQTCRPFSSSTHDAIHVRSSPEEDTDTGHSLRTISASPLTFSGSPGQGHLCKESQTQKPLDETQLHNHRLRSERVRIIRRLKFNYRIVTKIFRKSKERSLSGHIKRLTMTLHPKGTERLMDSIITELII